MGYCDTKSNNCIAASQESIEEYEEETGETYVPPCDWVAVGTYSDECKTCGAVASYW